MYGFEMIFIKINSFYYQQFITYKNQMSDKAKYASHGVYIKKISENHLAKWSKPKSAVINPLPSTKPRQKIINQQQSNILLASNKFNAKFKFQEPLTQKPIPLDLVQPFLYIEKVINKRKTNQLTAHEKNNKKGGTGKAMKPFITSSHSNNNKNKTNNQTKTTSPPEGYSNLYDFENDKKHIANLIFQKMLEAGIQNVKDLYNLWNKDPRRNLTADININEEQFIDFIKEIIPNKVTNANIRHFFKLYRNKVDLKKISKMQLGSIQLGRSQKIQQTSLVGSISIRAFSYNYSKYKKAQTQIVNIMSEKAAKDRYTQLKKLIIDYLSYYPELKIGMKGVKQYEETLRKHFQRIYESYQNPFEQQILECKAQLQKPIIKYDKEKKQKMENKIKQYEDENNKMHSKLTEDYNNFMQAYEQAIVKNHDLFFTKRTVAHLIWPILDSQPLITRDMIENQTQLRQEQKQKYLETLSDIVVEIDNDKKHLAQNCFTLGQIVQIVNMKYRNIRTQAQEQAKAFTIESLKKLIKQIKRQFLVKFNLVVDDSDSFPADQQIPMQILHTCFEMQCTKVLFKNRIWTELLQMIPIRSVQSRLHQMTIDANTCLQYLLKYFKKLDEKSRLELNKSKQISLLAEKAYNQNFGLYAEVIWKVLRNADIYVEGADQQEDLIQEERKKKKKVGFADIVDSKLAVDRGQKEPENHEEKNQMAKQVLKLIYEGLQGKDNSGVYNNQSNVPNIKINGKQEGPKQAFENLQMLKSMAKSYFQPQAMNTNAFDIRFYEKMAQQEKISKIPQQQMIQLGNSMILSGAPRVQQLEGNDPLRVSRFLLKTIDKQVQEQQKQVQNKQYQKNIEEGVSNNYYREKIKLEKRPTRYDSEGKSKYSVVLPVGYYQSYIVGQSVPDNEKWYLRPHHVQTLTENPLSKKDNIIQTEYQSKLQKLGLKKRPDEFVIEKNVKRKQDLIGQLEERIKILKSQLVSQAKRKNESQGQKVHPTLVDKYYENITQGKQDKDLELAAYEGVLYDLRKKQRSLLNEYRGNETRQQGEPHQKWWQKKDKEFNRQLRKDRQLISDSSGLHRSYVQKLKNNEVY